MSKKPILARKVTRWMCTWCEETHRNKEDAEDCCPETPMRMGATK